MENSNRTDIVSEEELPFMDKPFTDDKPFMKGKPFSSDLFIIDDEVIAKLEEEYFRTLEWFAWGR